MFAGPVGGPYSYLVTGARARGPWGFIILLGYSRSAARGRLILLSKGPPRGGVIIPGGFTNPMMGLLVIFAWDCFCNSVSVLIAVTKRLSCRLAEWPYVPLAMHVVLVVTVVSIFIPLVTRPNSLLTVDQPGFHVVENNNDEWVIVPEYHDDFSRLRAYDDDAIRPSVRWW